MPNRPVDVVVLAIECRDAVRPELAHDLHAFVEHADPVTRGRESVAVRLPFVLVPASADTHLGPSTRDDVDGRRDLGEVGRIAIPHAGAHLPQPNPLGACRECGHERPGLVGDFVGRHWHGVEVVIDPDRFPRSGLGGVGYLEHGRPLLGCLDASQIESPALWDEQSEAHEKTLVLTSIDSPGVGSMRSVKIHVRIGTVVDECPDNRIETVLVTTT